MRLYLCSCADSQSVDAKRISAATGLEVAGMHSDLCGVEGAALTEAIQSGEAVIACGQMATLFDDIAEELEVAPPVSVDIRDRAGWGDGDVAPKQAALIAEALVPQSETRLMDVESAGACLIIGAADIALSAAEALRDTLAVTVLLPGDVEEIMSCPSGVQIVKGALKRASGALGQFDLAFDALAELSQSGRGAWRFGPAAAAESSCDIILDLSGGTPLFPAPEKRDGYLRADPGNPLGVAEAARTAADLVGTFEKPLYIRFDENLCAHSRSRQTGCTRCLDLCPTGAILPNGDTVSIDPAICAGCGACAAACPSGAASYDDPSVSTVFQRLTTLSETYRSVAKNAPRLLVLDDHGSEMVRLLSRFGTGLPADVIPFEISAIAAFGHAEILAALGVGFASVDILLPPKGERDPIAAQVALANAIAGSDLARCLDVADPDAVPTALTGAASAKVSTPILPLGGRRDVTRLAAQALRGDATIALPEGAPYGAALVNEEACTLCLACAGHCPSGALLDDEDHPRLRFREDACLQCGICATICPEDAITLEPRLDLSADALTQKVVKEEEPFACIECGKLFGVKSTIERIVEKLEGNHAMFTLSDNTRLIRMCDDCRVNAQFHSENNPFKGKDRPRVRTTDDYLDE